LSTIRGVWEGAEGVFSREGVQVRGWGCRGCVNLGFGVSGRMCREVYSSTVVHASRGFVDGFAVGWGGGGDGSTYML
jgi:hypothetical protein